MNENLKRRWIEVRFAYLCYDLYNRLKSYPLIVSYLDVLSEIANIDKLTAVRLLQKVTQINHIKPDKSEYIMLAKANGESISAITKVLKISKTTYLELWHIAQENKSNYYPQCTVSENTIMEAILKAHARIKESGL